MNNKLIWMLSPAIYALLGMLAAYLADDRNMVMGSAFGGAIAGAMVAAFATAGEKD
ncbi:hypothetical protein [Thalassoroseus pseudoceratinae]|uniref:hypothetical protein n=1 Tax=Thalassoroseus pseudoceratinae TaxID=2713176 RepID=UPI0014237ACB|nr:hypothetical protein [Thalassoroseus pseudoceratinae]